MDLGLSPASLKNAWISSFARSLSKLCQANRELSVFQNSQSESFFEEVESFFEEVETFFEELESFFEKVESFFLDLLRVLKH